MCEEAAQVFQEEVQKGSKEKRMQEFEAVGDLWRVVGIDGFVAAVKLNGLFILPYNSRTI